MISFGHPRYQKLTYREGVRKGNVLFGSGIGPFTQDEARDLVGVGDIEAQTRQIYEQMEKVLQTAGASFDDVVKTVDYITPEALKDYRKTAQVRREYFTGTFPAATGFVVNQLLRPQQLIEVDCVAVLG